MIDAAHTSLYNTVFRSLKRTHDMFGVETGRPQPYGKTGAPLLMSLKLRHEYGHVINSIKVAKKVEEYKKMALPLPPQSKELLLDTPERGGDGMLMITAGPAEATKYSSSINGLSKANWNEIAKAHTFSGASSDAVSLLPQKAPVAVKPIWHPPWKLYRVISGHTGWVRSIDVEPGNEWFCTGGADRIIKIWDLASGRLKLSLTGHISTVRAVKVSVRQPYLFSAGEDKQVKCWDLEYNKVVRHYHGHLSAVYDLALHPSIDVLVTVSRDATCRVWDMRTKAQVHCLTGHTNTVACVVCQSAEPQVITGSHDSTIRLWDLAGGRSMCTLTNHKKSVRALALHPRLYMFASASPDNIKQWKCPNGEFIQNLSGHSAIVNALAVNEDSVLVSGGDNGSMYFWDWKSGICFQKYQTKPQPGSIDSEAGIFALCFDQSGSRLITGEADKTIKMFKEDETATEESHPILWRPDTFAEQELEVVEIHDPRFECSDEWNHKLSTALLTILGRNL
ncbi:Pleiotropic regulator 1 [Trichinella sp. T6]|uniref:Pleiotropic regulator 1 n=1 Tax=Trichinella murrelli TaxID=144512 RepID=A0A0V0TVE9_9BILA|nr:Pleiotropic regulator 1 [Trichinella murrelli]KRX73655.1 Pleiotropic regulator 1 [Trichinella sp. T6]